MKTTIVFNKVVRTLIKENKANRRWTGPTRWSLKALGATLVLAGGLCLPALASDPVGIYAFVDKVVMEPSEGAPERIQVWGGFALAEGRGFTYAPAKRGVMYFKLKPGKETVCRNEWADLKSVADTAQIVSFASRHEPRGTVRKPDAKLENPDPYPLGWGMQKVTNKDYKPVKELLALRESPAPKPTTTRRTRAHQLASR
jgi:hypothetical protein